MNDANRCDNCHELLVDHATLKANPDGWVHICKPSGVSVPAELVEALREALADGPDYTPTRLAARALVDWVAEHES